MSDLSEQPEPYLVIDASIDYPPYYARPSESRPIQQDERASTPHVGSTEFDTRAQVRLGPTSGYDPDILDKSPLGAQAQEIARQLRGLQTMANRLSTASKDMYRQLGALVDAANGLAAASGTPPHLSTMPESYKPTEARFQLRHSLTYEGVSLTDELAAKIWRKVVRTADHWIWSGMRHKQSGRPMVRVGTRMTYTHRVIYALHTGQNVSGQYLKNFCGEAACIRPDHHRLMSHPATAPRVDDPYRLPEDDIKVLLPEVTIHTTAAGRPKLCRKGHTMSVQPGGRPACRVCDRLRHGSRNPNDMIAVLAERSKTRAASTDISEQLDYELGIFDRPGDVAERALDALPDAFDNDLDALIAEHFIPDDPSDLEEARQYTDNLERAVTSIEQSTLDTMSRLKLRGLTVVPTPE